MSNYRNLKGYHIEQLRDPEDAVRYLSVMLGNYEENEDIEALLFEVKDGAKTRDSMTKFAERVS